MEHNYRFPVLKLKMTNPDGEFAYLKPLPQVESKVKDYSKSGDELTWGIDLEVAMDVIDIAITAIDYANSVTNEFTFQIVDECNTGENPDMVYYTYSHENGCLIKGFHDLVIN